MQLPVKAEPRTCCAGAAVRGTHAGAPVHREAVSHDRSAVTIHGQPAVNCNDIHVWQSDERCIFHVDVNSAFLSWSALKQLEENPGSVDLRTIPSAVGGDVRTRHGIITAKSIPAKKFGIETGEPVVKALQKCPDLVLVKSDFATYRRYSHALMDILREYTDLVEQVSIDEAYLDVTDSPWRYGAQPEQEDAQDPRRSGSQPEQEETQDPWPLNLAHHIRKHVFRELKFTVNVGISTNKLLAKMASDFEKPDRVHTLFPEEIPVKMWPLPVRELHGCGKATARKLYQMGIGTIGEAAAIPEEVLKANLGEKGGEYIWRSANGIHSATVHAEHDKAKSYSNEETTSSDINADNYRPEGLEIVRYLGRKVAGRLAKDQVFAQTIGVNVKTGEFQRISRQITLPEPTRDEEVICREAEKLMDTLLTGPDGLFARGQVVRLIGVGCSNLSDGSYMQLDLFSWAEKAKTEKGKEEARKAEEEAREAACRAEEAAREAQERAREEEQARQEDKRQRLEAMMKQVRSRYGDDAIHVGKR